MVKRLNTGQLCLVVGPSGVGKDSLLEGAKVHFAADPNVVFPIRTITRPADAGGEHHTAVDETSFQTLASTGQFALHWQAHGLYYGVPKSIDRDIENGRTAIVNVSRTILDDARARYANLTVLSVNTRTDILAERLRKRGRECEEDIQRRLTRAEQMRPKGLDVVEIDNSGLLTDAIDRFVDAIATAQRETAQ